MIEIEHTPSMISILNNKEIRLPSEMRNGITKKLKEKEPNDTDELILMPTDWYQ